MGIATSSHLTTLNPDRQQADSYQGQRYATPNEDSTKLKGPAQCLNQQQRLRIAAQVWRDGQIGQRCRAFALAGFELLELINIGQHLRHG